MKDFETTLVGGFNKVEVIKYIEISNSEKENNTKKLYEEKENNKRLKDDIDQIKKENEDIINSISDKDSEIVSLKNKLLNKLSEEKNLKAEISILEEKVSQKVNNTNIFLSSEDIGKVIIESRILADNLMKESLAESENKLNYANIKAKDMLDSANQESENIRKTIEENLFTVKSLFENLKDEYFRLTSYMESCFDSCNKTLDSIIAMDAEIEIESENTETQNGITIEL